MVKTQDNVPPEISTDAALWIMFAFNAVIAFFMLLFNDYPFGGNGFFGNIAATIFGVCLGAVILTPVLFFVEAPILLIGEDIYRAIKYKV